MTRGKAVWVDVFNGLAACVAVASSMAVTLSDSTQPVTSKRVAGDTPAQTDPRIPLANHGFGIRDASGEVLELGDFQRIASASGLSDALLLELCDPRRIVAFSGRKSDAPDAHRYKGQPTIGGIDRVERMLELKPDLVLLNRLGREDHLVALRRAGLPVFDLGPMHGVETFRHAAVTIGWLLGHPERARNFVERFQQRLASVADAIPRRARKSGLYLGMHANYLSGGTTGSSYHDVLRYAGLTDAASARFDGWPSYSPEQLLALDPDVIVTQSLMGTEICGHEPLSLLRACSLPRGVVEIPPYLIHDAGLGMLPAAEAVYRAVYAPANTGQEAKP